MTIYLHDWKVESWTGLQGKKALIDDFELSDEQKADLINYKILLASYSYQDYSGDAYVLLLRKDNGSLFEVHGNHCSCYGLEGQWELEETTLASIKWRLEKGELGSNRWNGNEFSTELSRIVKRLEKNA